MTPPLPTLLSGSVGGAVTNHHSNSGVGGTDGGDNESVVSATTTPIRRRTTYDKQEYKAHYLDDFSWFGGTNKKRDFRRAIRSWSGYGTLSSTGTATATDITVADIHAHRAIIHNSGGGGGGGGGGGSPDSPLLGIKRRYQPQIIHQSSNSLLSSSETGTGGGGGGKEGAAGRLGASATSPVPLTHAASVGSGVNAGEGGGGGVGNKKTRSSLWAMPGIKSLVNRRRNSGGTLDVSTNSTASTTSPTAPLVTRRNNPAATGSGTSGTITTTTTTTTITTMPMKPEISITSSTSGLTTTHHNYHHHHHHNSSSLLRPAALLGSLVNLRRCGADPFNLTTTLHSSTSSSSIEPLQPINRLRVSPHGSTARMCSRCSSLLTLATGSRYSLDKSTGGFVPVLREDDTVDSRGRQDYSEVRRNSGSVRMILCKMCLEEVRVTDSCVLEQCGCCFCVECMCAYVKYEITQGAYDVSCPDAQCPAQGTLTQQEIKRLAGNDLLEKHLKYRLNIEVETDKSRMWCPRAGCETVCTLCAAAQRCEPQSVHCPTCTVNFCSNCKLEWHTGLSCDDNTKQLAKEGKVEEPGIPFDSDLIKCCPMCKVPIEKDEGCAQMMCKRCKHVFCWYCLASLDDDFLLRHYDKGPCKNKLGHSRASVIWHRTQVITIFAGFGILLLVASPLLLLAAPCIVCCKCRVCNAGTAAAAASTSSASKLDEDGEEREIGAAEKEVLAPRRQALEEIASVVVETGGGSG